MSSPKKKQCPKCAHEKRVSEFYPCRDRSDGLSSWCKLCSNTSRKTYKPSVHKVEYRAIAKAASLGLKPTVCPDCNTPGIPSHKMRGRLENGDVRWSCLACRMATIEVHRPSTHFCGWCNDPFKALYCREFCTKSCEWVCFRVRAERVLREAEANEHPAEKISGALQEAVESHRQALNAIIEAESASTGH